jgi:pyruvate,water dikinase
VFTWPAELVPLGGPADTTQREFTALAVSPGVATGKARVILDAYEDAHIEPGEILIAPVTDAPWTPLFVPAAAVVVEMGGVLSHAATVAREFGIPGVSGVKDATRIIKTGQVITVDGNAGTVRIVSG